MRRFILGILCVVLASDSIKVYHCQRVYRNEYTENREFFRVFAGLTQVPTDIPDEATEVNLRYNMITNIPINGFSNLRNCSILRLTSNQISEIESGMFNGLVSLTLLDLSGNKITTVGENSFHGLTLLTTLRLVNNKFTIISEKMFSSLQACTILYLQNNRISEIAEGTFAKLISAKTIHLDGNNIQTVPANVFPNTLDRLTIGSNKISSLENVDFTNLVFLTLLNIGNCRISSLPANALSTLSNCKILYLHNNPIEDIEVGAFHGLDKVSSLYLYGTSLTHLSPNMFQGLPSLHHLQLDQSRISQIARGAFTDLDRLITLILNKNELTVIESYMFSGLISLRYFFLNQNNITDIRDSAFLMLGNLTSLYLYENQLEHLSMNSFAGLVSLKVLDLGLNKLTTLDPLVLSPLKRPLELAMEAPQTPSSMVCDMKLCWLKMEEEARRIVFNFRQVSYTNEHSTDVYYPTCTGGDDWRLLQCPETLPCRDPGEVEFAERSGSFLPLNNNAQPGLDLPYSTDSQFSYTCQSGYTGGGTITCQSNGQWTRKPECIRLFNTETPARDTETTTEGIRNGAETTTSSRTTNSQTTGSPTTGSLITDSPGQGTKPESGATEGGSSGLIYGIVGAVCGIVVTALVGLITFCIKRLKKNNADTIKTQNIAAGDEASEAGYVEIVNGPKGKGLNTDTANYIDIVNEPQGKCLNTDTANYVEIVNGPQNKGLNTQPDPAADRGIPQPTVTGDGTGYNNNAYEDEYQEIGKKIGTNNITMTVGRNGPQGNGLNTQPEPAADRDTPQPTVTEEGTVFINPAYEGQEIKDALPNNNPYEDVEDLYDN